MGSTSGRIVIKWLLLGWVIVFGHVNHPGILYIRNTDVNSAFHPFGVGKPSSGLSGWG